MTTNQQPQKHHHHRRPPSRLVLLAGPHKSASSSTQEFFFRYATGGRLDDRRRLLNDGTYTSGNANNNSNNNNTMTIPPVATALKDWVWPFHARRPHYQSRKAYAILVKEGPFQQQQHQQQQQKGNPHNQKNTLDVNVQRHKQKMINEVYASIRKGLLAGVGEHEQQQEKAVMNLILGTEEFDRFGTCPWSHRNGLKAADDLIRKWITWTSTTRSSTDTTTATTTTTITSQNQSRGENNSSSMVQKDQSDNNNNNIDNDAKNTENLVEWVVNYRRPRRDQWASIWRELTHNDGMHNMTYHDWMCRGTHVNSSSDDNNDHQQQQQQQHQQQQHHQYAYQELWEYLDSVANPIGFVNALLDHYQPPSPQSQHSTPYDDNNNETATTIIVHLMDMQGIEKAGLDISHVIACRVLGAYPCLNGWLAITTNNGTSNIDGYDNDSNNNTTSTTTTADNAGLRVNQKHGDPGLSQEQMEDMEFLLRMRDCFYQSRLDRHRHEQGRLVVHLGESLWEECPSWNETNEMAQHWNVTSTTDLLDLLRDQVGCGSGRLSMAVVRTVREAMEEQQRSFHQLLQNKGQGGGERGQYVSVLYQTAQTQHIVQLIILILGGLWLWQKVTSVRQRRRRRKPQNHHIVSLELK